MAAIPCSGWKDVQGIGSLALASRQCPAPRGPPTDRFWPSPLESGDSVGHISVGGSVLASLLQVQNASPMRGMVHTFARSRASAGGRGADAAVGHGEKIFPSAHFRQEVEKKKKDSKVIYSNSAPSLAAVVDISVAPGFDHKALRAVYPTPSAPPPRSRSISATLAKSKEL